MDAPQIGVLGIRKDPSLILSLAKGLFPVLQGPLNAIANETSAASDQNSLVLQLHFRLKCLFKCFVVKSSQQARGTFRRILIFHERGSYIDVNATENRNGIPKMAIHSIQMDTMIRMSEIAHQWEKRASMSPSWFAIRISLQMHCNPIDIFTMHNLIIRYR